jgi:hypothetical protein
VLGVRSGAQPVRFGASQVLQACACFVHVRAIHSSARSVHPPRCNAHVVHDAQVDDDAPPEVIKLAYRALAKSCHPDFLGQKGHNVCILLNEVWADANWLCMLALCANTSLLCVSVASDADRDVCTQAYAILSDPDTRMEYNRQLEQALTDEDDSFTGAAAVAANGRSYAAALQCTG